MGRACYAAGGCPTDYTAAVLTGVLCAWLAVMSAYVFHHRQSPLLRAKHVPLVIVAALSSIVWLVSMVVSQGLFKMPTESFLDSCTLWKVWLGGLLGFGLWMSCHIARGLRLYFVFVKKRYSPLSAFWVVCLLLIPWLAVALAFQFGDALNNVAERCTAPLAWYIPLASIYGVYVLAFVGTTLSVRGIHFFFNEYRDQKRSAAAMVVFVGVWLSLWLAKRIAGDSEQRLQVAVRFTLVLAADVAAFLFFWMPIQAPLRLLWGSSGVKTPKDTLPGDHTALTMGPVLTEKMLDAERLETLLGIPKFLEAFKEFADSRLAGECVHFFEAVQRRGQLATAEERIYTADDVIEKFIRAGSPMQINISSAMRTRVLRQKDLAAEDLFSEASREAMRIMQTNLEKDFQKSPHFAALKCALADEASEQTQLRLLGISEASTFEHLARLTAPSKRELVESPMGDSKSAAFDGSGKVLEPGSASNSRKRLWGPLEERSDEAGAHSVADNVKTSLQLGFVEQRLPEVLSESVDGTSIIGEDVLVHSSDFEVLERPLAVESRSAEFSNSARTRRQTEPSGYPSSHVTLESQTSLGESTTGEEPLLRSRRASEPRFEFKPRTGLDSPPVETLLRLESRLRAANPLKNMGCIGVACSSQGDNDSRPEDTLL